MIETRPSPRLSACVISTLATVLILLFSALTASAQLPVTDDSYTQQGSPTTNSGTASTLIVRGSPTAQDNTYLRFNLSPLPAGLTASNVANATAEFFLNSVATAGSFDVFLVNGTWSEHTITYKTAPALGTKIASAVPVTSSMADNYLLINVTPAVQAWLSGTANFGLALMPTAGSTINVALDSKESAGTSHSAFISVALVSAGPQGPAGPQGATRC